MTRGGGTAKRRSGLQLVAGRWVRPVVAWRVTLRDGQTCLVYAKTAAKAASTAGGRVAAVQRERRLDAGALFFARNTALEIERVRYWREMVATKAILSPSKLEAPWGSP